MDASTIASSTLTDGGDVTKSLWRRKKNRSPRTASGVTRFSSASGSRPLGSVPQTASVKRTAEDERSFTARDHPEPIDGFVQSGDQEARIRRVDLPDFGLGLEGRGRHGDHAFADRAQVDRRDGQRLERGWRCRAPGRTGGRNADEGQSDES